MLWNPKFVILLMVSTLVSYFVSLKMGEAESTKTKKWLLITGLTTNLGLLFVFKYFNFFIDNINLLSSSLNLNYQITIYKILLPIGISFYTFQTLGYVIDVYRGAREPERHLGIYAVFISFFPQVLAGPIGRSTHLLPQFRQQLDFSYENIREGSLLMMQGYIKKMLIADRLALLVNAIFDNVYSYKGLELIIAIIFFTIQIYCDFSAYSDIARGSAKFMGIDLMENFRRPYISRSFKEFWARWHISLSTWFRDYLYISLGGNRVSKNRNYFNLFIVFLLSGIWHGANWTFLIWGGLHGALLVIEKMASPFIKKIRNLLRISETSFINTFFSILITFAFVSFAWMFFRANTVHDSIYIVKNMFVFNQHQIKNIVNFKLGLEQFEFYLAIILIIILFIKQFVGEKIDLIRFVLNQNIFIRWAVYLMLVFSVVIFGVYGDYKQSDFIYFRF
jgi:D-alanyl-lipoteichoic acid acyltransferase DltB (MBOAT superfamily)